MAAHNLALAKASLAAGLMRPDPQPVPREELRLFHESFEASLEKCSTNDIQRCKEWLLRNQITSTARSELLGKYLVAVSSSLGNQDIRRASSTRRQHLAILYILNDLLHHLKYHEKDQSLHRSLVDGLSRHLPGCVSYATTFDEKSFPRHKRRIAQLLEEWSRNQYCPSSLQRELEQVAAKAVTNKTTKSGGLMEAVKQDDPFIMPAIHGDPSAPYHELPAASLMPHIIPNTPVPINPHHVRALQFSQGPAEPTLVEVLKTFLKDIDLLYDTALPEDEAISIELDDLGQKIVRDKQSGILLSTETYYGWSREFCENMKRKQNNRQGSQDQDSEDSRARSVSPRKRMRYGRRDASPGRQNFRRRPYSRSTATSRSRSRSRSRIRSPARHGNGLHGSRPRSRSYSRSRSRSRSPSRSKQQPQRKPFQQQPRIEPPARNLGTTDTSYQQNFKSQNAAPLPSQTQSLNQQVYLSPQPPPPQIHPPPPPPPPQSMPSAGNYYNPGMIPPRPSNWQGPWPPPPPPSLQQPGPGNVMYPHAQYQAQQYQYTTSTGVWPGMPVPPPSQAASLPPPPPPPQYAQQQQGYGQNYGAYNNSYGQKNGGRGGNRW